MPVSFEHLFQELTRLITDRGVDVRTREMDLEKPGEFDGPTITINPVHALEPSCYYLAHSFGSIYQWSAAFANAKGVFDGLRSARSATRPIFEEALQAWRRFEEISSEHATWVFEEIGHAPVIPAYTLFFRADIEAMTIFHRTGKEPPWPAFLADFKDRVARGEIKVAPFPPRPVFSFRPRIIEVQEVQQERD